MLEMLGDELPGADLTTLLLEVMRRRSQTVGPADVLRRYESDRFVAPAPVVFADLRRIEDAFLSALPPGFDVIELAPVVPLGTHAAVSPVDQNRVVSTVRSTEVAADPTSGLALEVALRRRALLRADPRSSGLVRLAATQRVVRAQRFDHPEAFAHFAIFGLVTGGRDTGNLAFERESAAEHVRFAVDAVRATGVRRVRVELTDFEEGRTDLVVHVVAELDAQPGVDVVERPDRVAARGYYRGFCWKGFALFGEEAVEVADGGHVDWTQQYLANRKERLMITGIGLDRLALRTVSGRAPT